ncbi:MAG: RIP metalloprotease RseP [Gemmatimonadota bacterium]|nr:RIP metalloprotease RseP [Gemmatimonadota bacterium]
MLVWLAPVFVLGLVVFVHELGHFLAAKTFGVYAPRFSIGFGPAIVKKRIGETEYRIGILPIGGYVRMASRLDEASASLEGGSELSADSETGDPNELVPFGTKPVPENRWFESKPLAARLVIMLAGVTMNVLLGFVINVSLASIYERAPTSRISEVLANKPAALAGLQAGDSIVSVNGATIGSWNDFVAVVKRSSGTPVALGVLRKGAPLAVSVTPVAESVSAGSSGARASEGRIGVAAGQSSASIPLGQAIADGGTATLGMGTLVFTSLRSIVTRRVSMSELGGPILIAQSSVQAARQGGSVLFYLIALLSVNLAVFNLLPVPILDGGQVVVQVIESARGRPLSDRARENVARLGLVLILALFVMVTFNDLKRLIFGAVAGHPG